MKCRYCQMDAGFLRSQHGRCRAVHDSGQKEMVALAESAASGTRPVDNLVSELRNIAAVSYVDPAGVRAALVQGLISATDMALDDHILTEDEEASLNDFADAVAIGKDDIEMVEGSAQSLMRISQGRVLRELQEGKIPDSSQFDGVGLPFNFMKSETLVYALPHVDYYEDRVRRERVGQSIGGATRVARGVYIGGSTFRSRTVETEVTEHVDTGTLAMTTKHIYFSGTRKKFRVRFDRIVSFDAYSNGLGITRDAQNARTQKFLVDDGWFVCNLATLLAERV